MKWNVKKFNQLDINTLYSILKLRSEVFVLEQNCPYLDIDEKDQKALHIFSLDANNNCIAYGRIFKPNDYYKNYTAITRIVIREKNRNKKLGYELVQKLIDICKENYKEKKIKISAQKHLQKFYEKCGFVFEGDRHAREVLDYAVELPTVHPWLAPLLQMTMAQLLSYYAALDLGRNIDKPRNLAKSVTVG